MEERLAERVGFEPTVSLHPRRISSAVHSTTLPPLRPGEPNACVSAIHSVLAGHENAWSIREKAGH